MADTGSTEKQTGYILPSYFEGIEFATEKSYRFNPGTQGEHKILEASPFIAVLITNHKHPSFHTACRLFTARNATYKLF